MAAGLILATLLVAAPEAPRKVPEALVPVLDRAQKALAAGRPKDALAALASYDGQEPLHQLLLGHAHYEAKDGRAAETAYRRALALDESLSQAWFGLARILVDRAAWREAADVLAKVVKVDEAKAAELGMYARVAYELRDFRLASLLVERGILRFPKDASFRRLDVALLLERQDPRAAYEAAWTLLAANPEDELAWRQLAAVGERLEDETLRLSTLEASMLASGDPRLARRHALAQYAAGHTGPALAAVKRLLESSPQDLGLIELAVRIAEEAGDLVAARAWLARVEPGRRTKTLTLVEAKLALREGDPKAAEGALERLIRAGEANANVFLWAGQLAEQLADPARAEAFYSQASDLAGPNARLAVLHLARLLHRIDQRDRASQVLATYLAKHPDDAPAKTLYAVIAERGKLQVE